MYNLKYQGSKNRVAKDLAPIIQGYIDKYNITDYFEPFCGGCNMIDKIKCCRRVASDNNKWLISLITQYKTLNLPDVVTREHYNEIRNIYRDIQQGKPNTSVYTIPYISAIGFFASYNGRFFEGGYAGMNIKRNYYAEAKRNFEKQLPLLRDIVFLECDYTQIAPLTHNTSVIYCDPPYQFCQSYSTSRSFDHEAFWSWVRMMSLTHIVLVSEQNAPSDFTCIWERDIKRTVSHYINIKATEKLFIYSQSPFQMVTTNQQRSV